MKNDAPADRATKRVRSAERAANIIVLLAAIAGAASTYLYWIG